MRLLEHVTIIRCELQWTPLNGTTSGPTIFGPNKSNVSNTEQFSSNLIEIFVEKVSSIYLSTQIYGFKDTFMFILINS